MIPDRGLLRRVDSVAVSDSVILGNWPLIVSISLPKNEIYAGAWWRLLWRSAFAAVTLAGLLALTALVARQARQEAMLMGELEHRLKNVLAVVDAVINRASEESQSTTEFLSSLRAAFNRLQIHNRC